MALIRITGDSLALLHFMNLQVVSPLVGLLLISLCQVIDKNTEVYQINQYLFHEFGIIKQ